MTAASELTPRLPRWTSPPLRRGQRLHRGRMAPEPRLLRHPLRVEPNTRCRHRVITRQSSPGTIGGPQARDAPADGGAGFGHETRIQGTRHNRLHPAPDRHRRFQRPRYRSRRALAEAAEGAMYRRNQTPDLLDTDAIFLDITTDDLRNAGGDLQRIAVIGHIFCLNLVD